VAPHSKNGALDAPPIEAHSPPPWMLVLASSGRSIRVAPAVLAANRVLTSTSPWSANPFSAVRPPSPWSSGSHAPLPSSLNFAS
jgi:hypothetical protein